MNYDETRDALEGMFAYDAGSTCSGIHNPILKAQVKHYLDALSPLDQRTFLAKIITELWLNEQALESGYGPEDAYEFLRWLEDNEMLIPKEGQ